ncbi:MAG TPA: hypothetical protein VGR73_07155 [Bryobacteraceae bacterium]|nr:hypothetical protein [Bryobacteraceae bacterium]
MLRKISLTLCVAIVLSCVTARASDWTEPGGGTLAQIMDQGGARTTFTLINLDAVAAPYTLNFYGDNGNPLTLSTTAGTAASLSGTLPVNGSIIIQTNGSAAAPLVQGYAVLVTSNTIAGSAVFGLPIGNGFFESTCPLDTGTDYKFGIPFDHTTPGTVVGVALANDFGYAPLNITVTAYDENGVQLATPALPAMLANTHTAFLLTDKFPALKNAKGTIWFTAVDGMGNGTYFNVLGVRATTGTYTSIVPIVQAGF